MKLKNLIPQSAKNTFKHLPLAVLSNILYGFPSRGLTIIGVTGTDGKTTTCNMIYRILQKAGKKAAVVSTINAIIDGREYDTGFHVTSPDPVKVQKLIKEAKKRGVEYLVLEVTSHAIDQHRFFGIKFDIAAVTNITHEHLDYHRSFENYRRIKAKLLRGVKTAVLNYDDSNFGFLSNSTTADILSFGLDKRAKINPDSLPFRLKVPGEYNKLNALAAAGVALSLGIKEKEIKQALEGFESLNGRMEEVKNKRGIRIFIDFAHTPNGLENALSALKGFKKSGDKLISLIGAEGYRDKGKRAKMGEIATRLSDKVIITAVDPRGLIDEINSQILEGAKKAKGSLGKDIFIENDRQEAIGMAIGMAKKGDIIGIFGKGHETSMNLDGKKELPWNDRKAVEKILSKL